MPAAARPPTRLPLGDALPAENELKFPPTRCRISQARVVFFVLEINGCNVPSSAVISQMTSRMSGLRPPNSAKEKKDPFGLLRLSKWWRGALHAFNRRAGSDSSGRRKDPDRRLHLDVEMETFRDERHTIQWVSKYSKTDRDSKGHRAASIPGFQGKYRNPLGWNSTT